jgi:hypothetical protein
MFNESRNYSYESQDGKNVDKIIRGIFLRSIKFIVVCPLN